MTTSLRQVAVFEAVARTLHFGRAADELFVSQSMISQEIRRFEARLGVTLFDRSTRRVALTRAGEAMVSPARALLDASREFDVSSRVAARTDSSHITLVASPSAMNDLVPRVLRRSEKDLPYVTVDDLAVDTGEVGAMLTAGRADVGVGRFLDLPSSFVVERLSDDRVVVAIGADHAAASSPVIDLRVLQDLPLLLWPRERSPRYHDALMELCHVRGLDPIVLVSPPRIIGSRSYFLAENRAFTLVPQSTVGALPAGIVARQLAEPAYLSLEMAWRPADPRTELGRFVDLIRTVSGSKSLPMHGRIDRLHVSEGAAPSGTRIGRPAR